MGVVSVLVVLVCLVTLWFNVAEGEEDNAVSEIISRFDGSGKGELNETDFEQYFLVVFPTYMHDEHEHEHDPEISSVNVTNSSTTHEHCPGPEELFVQYDFDSSGYLNATEVEQVTVIMMGMLLECTFEHHDELDCGRPTTAEAWGFGFLASLLVTVISAIGVMLIPISDSKIRPFILNFFLAFAVGALFGDVLLHLLPQLHGAHGHGSEATPTTTPHMDHAEESPDTVAKELGPSLLVCFLMVLFFVIEKLLHKFQGHSHGQMKMSGDSIKGGDDDESSKGKILPAGYLILIADGIHNFFDGIAIGAAFTVNLNVGLVTTIAVFVHEIPQEFGDFALLVHAGFSRKQALLFNILSGATAILGTIIGLAAGALSEESEKWLLSFVIAAFLYISCVELIPQLHEFANTITKTVIQVMGIIAGFIVMLIIALFEIVPDCASH